MIALLTPSEAAERLQVSLKTLRRLRDKGLRYVMLSSGTIRYRDDDLAEFVQEKVQECRSVPRAPATSTTTFRSKVVDFTAVAAVWAVEAATWAAGAAAENTEREWQRRDLLDMFPPLVLTEGKAK